MTKKEDLQNRKLEMEIEFLKERLTLIRQSTKKKANIGDLVRKNLSLLLILISVIGGFVGVIIPLNSYIDSLKSAGRPNIDSSVFTPVQDLNQPQEYTEHTITLLSYYGLDAMPILLLAYNIADNDLKRTNLKTAIRNIYDYNKKGVMREILQEYKNFFYSYYKCEDVDVIPRYIDYYPDLIISLKLSNKDIRLLKDALHQFEADSAEIMNEEFKITFYEDLNSISNHFSLDSIKIKP